MTDFLTGFADGILNRAHNAILPQDDRESIKQNLELIKIACIVTAAVTLILFLYFPNIFMLLLAGIVSLGAKEVHAVCGNLLEMLNNVRIEMIARLSNENMAHQISKNTFVIGPIIKLIASRRR